jgi:hypothetical protein
MTDVLTRSFTNYRDGCQTQETKLTSEYVQAKGISILGTLQLDDPRGTEGQPLIASGLTMRDGQTHDVLFTCDMSNNVHAFDLTTYALLWKQHIGVPINVTQQWDMHNINPKWGILASPVINRTAGVLHFVSLSSPDGSMGKSAYRFHTVSLTDGADVAPPLALAGATYTPPGKPRLTLGSVPRKQRPALLLDTRNGHTTVFVAFGSFVESADTNVGWVLAIDVTGAAKPSIAAAWTTASGTYPGAGIWMGGEGLSMDDDGFLYAMTANGAFDPPTDFGNSFIKLKYTPPTAGAPGKVECVDWWTPYSDAGVAGLDPTLPSPNAIQAVADSMMVMPVNAMNMGMTADMAMGSPTNQRGAYDIDLGSGGPLLVPKSLSGFGHNVLIGAGKTGIAYVVNADNMGKTQRADFAPNKIGGNYAKLLSPPYGFTYYPAGIDLASADMTEIPATYGGYTHHVHGSPVCYESPDHGLMLFVGGENGPVRAMTLNADYSLTYLCSGQAIASQGMNAPGGMPGSMLTLSCDGQRTNTGVLWALMPWYGDANTTITAGRLVLYGANWDQNGTLIKLWDSADWNWQFKHNKFNKATVWGGKGFIPTYDGRILVVG